MGRNGHLPPDARAHPWTRSGEDVPGSGNGLGTTREAGPSRRSPLRTSRKKCWTLYSVSQQVGIMKMPRPPGKPWGGSTSVPERLSETPPPVPCGAARNRSCGRGKRRPASVPGLAFSMPSIHLDNAPRSRTVSVIERFTALGGSAKIWPRMGVCPIELRPIEMGNSG